MTGDMMHNLVQWSSRELCHALGCEGVGAWTASGVSIDSRTLQTGDLFVALQGPNHDGHDHVARAFHDGAVAAVVSRQPDDLTEDALSGDTLSDLAPLLVVGDTMIALEDLGRAARHRMAGKVIAVTGSVGKTGTKEMLRLAFEGQGLVSVSAGNLNNQFGVPLSLSRMAAETDYGVFEVGMNHPGEIRPLAKMIQPHVVVVTSVDAVHLEYFDSVEQIVDAKAEIFEGLAPGGLAIINRDNMHYPRLAHAAKVTGVKNIIGFGEHDDCQARLVSLAQRDGHSRIEAVICGETVNFELHVPGRHHVMNSLAVLAAVSSVGGNLQSAAETLKGFALPKGRGAQSRIRLGDGGEVLIIDESYNASPPSMHSALDILGGINPVKTGRRIAVLGDMLELGVSAPEMHRNLLDIIIRNNVDMVFACGPLMENLWSDLPDGLRGGYSISPEKVALIVASILQQGDVVMVKGSLGSRVGVIVDALLDLGER